MSYVACDNTSKCRNYGTRCDNCMMNWNLDDSSYLNDYFEGEDEDE